VTASSTSAGEGQPLTEVVARFTDSDPFSQVSDFQATVDWGDGQTSPGRVETVGAGTFAVQGTHTFMDEASYATTVHVTDVISGNSGVGDGAITVGETPMQVQAFSLQTAAGVSGLGS
jgi:hypothetical protein